MYDVCTQQIYFLSPDAGMDIQRLRERMPLLLYFYMFARTLVPARALPGYVLLLSIYVSPCRSLARSLWDRGSLARSAWDSFVPIILAVVVRCNPACSPCLVNCISLAPPPLSLRLLLFCLIPESYATHPRVEFPGYKGAPVAGWTSFAPRACAISRPRPPPPARGHFLDKRKSATAHDGLTGPVGGPVRDSSLFLSPTLPDPPSSPRSQEHRMAQTNLIERPPPPSSAPREEQRRERGFTTIAQADSRSDAYHHRAGGTVNGCTYV
ncbi:hypothetical protein LX32DRAFT_286942 [Colletotrichum zoysiae]|uniref:Uncharacterized protein n=1 Tax=Colletotrichum zoysiae TaxID=1216348 RepID=A0AAD9LTR2_9PEZI|nr:hypothetical protein LX32DRAFT_286942 [Colletotrichum zoysiae]